MLRRLPAHCRRGDAQALHSVVEECQALLPPGEPAAAGAPAGDPGAAAAWCRCHGHGGCLLTPLPSCFPCCLAPRCSHAAWHPAGTLVLGCCGRGLFGVERGQPVEIDPSERQARGASGGLALIQMRSNSALQQHKGAPQMRIAGRAGSGGSRSLPGWDPASPRREALLPAGCVRDVAPRACRP